MAASLEDPFVIECLVREVFGFLEFEIENEPVLLFPVDIGNNITDGKTTIMILPG